DVCSSDLNELSYLFVSVTLFCTLLIGCNTGPSKRVSLWRGDEIPYGTWYAYTQLPYLFTNAEISTWNKSPVKLHEGNASSSAYIIIGHTFKPGEEELKALLSYAIAGNHVFISVMEPGQNVLDSFRLSSAPSQFLQWKPDSLDLAIFDPATFDFLPFVYPGRSLDN